VLTDAEAHDADLATAAQSGEGSAFAGLLRRHGGLMRQIAFRYTRNAADADEVVQEAAVTIWRNLHALREPAKVRSWMLQITAREALRRVTAARQDAELTEDVVLVDGPDAAVDRFDLHEGVRKALRGMPEEHTRAWLLREAHGLSYREIAEQLDVTESSVRGWLARARKRIQSSVDECCPTARRRTVEVQLPIGGDAPPVVVPESSAVAIARPSRLEPSSHPVLHRSRTR
jgi:RNA polymerase sigma-70 factor (ECF subfamily)